MTVFHLPKEIILTVSAGDSPCLSYAHEEIVRLLSRIGCRVTAIQTLPGKCFWLGLNTLEIPTPSGLRHDGFEIQLQETSVLLCGLEPKGLLNAVYEFAELLGFTFLQPGPDGEWAPETPSTPETGTIRKNPRFPHRGLFLATEDGFSTEEHLIFLAKLKYNAVCRHGGQDAPPEIYRRLGIRWETGGHEMPACLDRKLFKEHPEYFRLFQPEDFNGTRMPDSNFCVTNPEVRRIVTRTFAEKLQAFPADLYAAHAWADDLPAGGWCMCPSCRSFSPADQNMLGMKLLCRGADTAGSAVRVPVIAYHDTLFPGEQTTPEPRMFLLWAPRERCYAHRLDDPDCPRNRIHWQALQKWTEKFRGINDAHTFEHYQDQCLFSGLYPFIPETIAGDMDAYEKAGIESHMTLQVCSWDILPDYDGLFFARAHWERGLDRKEFIRWLTSRLAGDGAKAFAAFLDVMADSFQAALGMCGYDMAIYLDYRWLPESNTEFAHQTAASYRTAAETLAAASESFRAAIGNMSSRRFQALAEKEVRRADFESAQFLSMHYQQSAMSAFARAHLENDADAARSGCELLRKSIEAEEQAAALARQAGYPEKWYFLNERSPWAIRESRDRIAKYSEFTEI